MTAIVRSSMIATALVAFAAVTPTGANAADAALTPAEITARIEAAGYADVHDVELDDGRYEADAVSPAGVHVDLHVDPVSGRIVSEHPDD